MIGVALPAAALVSSACCLVIVRTTLGRRFIDEPNVRSLHDRPVPRGGGVAVWCGIVAGALIAGLPLVSLLVPFTLLMLLGVIDDRRGVPARVRFPIQAVVVIGYFAVSAVAPAMIVILGRDVSLGVLALPLAAVASLWMLNLYNFMDGMDGFAGSMTVIGFGTLSWLAAGAGEPTLSAACALPAAAGLGFLVLNLPPARLFLGDSGSVPLGFLASALALTGVAQRVWSPVIPLVVFAPFILDATATLLRRVSRSERVWVAHRTHVYQRLVVAGLGHRRTLAVEVLYMGASALLAGMAQSRGAAGEFAALAVVVAIYVGLLLAAGRLERRRPAATL
jgi:UDP-N-acetylmuramyl pentapeptide phosphotransferase/UDP-N-acetylglucosamine-1-phosphate transferase